MRARGAAKRSTANRNLPLAPAAEPPPIRPAEAPQVPVALGDGQPARGIQGDPPEDIDRDPNGDLAMWDTLPIPGRVVPHVLTRGQVWRALQQHLRCRQLRRADLPHQLMVGFCCTCSGREEMWQIPLRDLRAMGPEWTRMFNALNYAEENWRWRRRVFQDEWFQAEWDLEDCDNNRAWRFPGRAVIGDAWINVRGLERLEVEYVKEEKERFKVRKEARRKAGVLLHRHVSEDQWEEFKRKKHIHVNGSDGRSYRVEKKIGGSVTLIIDGKDAARYCLVPHGHSWIPESDMMLAIKLMLETDALAFTKKANMVDLTTPPMRVEDNNIRVNLRIGNNGQLVQVECAEDDAEGEERLAMDAVVMEMRRRQMRRAG